MPVPFDPSVLHRPHMEEGPPPAATPPPAQVWESIGGNVFWIGRRRGDENQLTALLGALFRREPRALERFVRHIGLTSGSGDAPWHVSVELSHSAGRFDLVMERSGECLYVIESKIDSGLHITQVRRYLTRLAQATDVPNRALILLTRDPVSVTDDDQSFADSQSPPIAVSVARWSDLAASLPDPNEDSLAADFAALLMSEDLAPPPAVHADDWDVLVRARSSFRRLERLIEAAAQAVSGGRPDMATHRKIGATGYRRVQTDLRAGSLLLRIGVAASDGEHRPDTPPVVAVAVTDRDVVTHERRAWAERHSAKLAETEAAGRWVRRSFTAAQLLDGKTFPEQVDVVARAAQHLLVETEALLQSDV